MALFDQWPYVNIHNLNTDWLVKTVKAVKEKTDDIDDSVARARDSAANAKTSEDNAKLSEDAAAEYYELTSALVGKPLSANTLADMTDTTTIYIYTGSEPGMINGDWYYYDGNDWVDGGTYGAVTWVTTNAANLIYYILQHVAYTDPDMSTYVDALYDELLRGIIIGTNFSVTNALVNVTTSNHQTVISGGSSYTATLTLDNGYAFDLVRVTMDGVDITSTAYNNGVITIASVTGDIVITASAVLVVRYLWKLTDGDLHKQAGSITWDSTHDISTATTAGALNGRRNIYIDIGVKPYNTTTDNITFVVTDPPQYPIPIPSDAVSVTYAVTPNTQFMGVALYTYDSDTNTYTRTDDIGWQQGSHTVTFTPGTKHYLTSGLKYDTAGSSYPTEPSEITITFNT